MASFFRIVGYDTTANVKSLENPNKKIALHPNASIRNRLTGAEKQNNFFQSIVAQVLIL
jgi:hypothetical protein